MDNKKYNRTRIEDSIHKAGNLSAFANALSNIVVQYPHLLPIKELMDLVWDNDNGQSNAEISIKLAELNSRLKKD